MEKFNDEKKLNKKEKQLSLQPIWLFFAATTTIFFLAQIYFQVPITSDAFERSRVAEGLQQGLPPQTTTTTATTTTTTTAIGAESGTYGANGNYGKYSNYNYPLLFDFILATFSSLLGLKSFQTLSVLSILFSAILFPLFFLLARFILGIFTPENGNEKTTQTALLAAAFAILSPMLYYRTVTPISETLGILLFLATTYAYLKHGPKLSFFFLFALSLAHFRSFAVALALLFLLSLFYRGLQEFAKTAALPAAIFFITLPKDFNITNPWVQTPQLPAFENTIELIQNTIAPLGLASSAIPLTRAFELFAYAHPLLLAFFAIGLAVLAKKVYNTLKEANENKKTGKNNEENNNTTQNKKQKENTTSLQKKIDVLIKPIAETPHAKPAIGNPIFPAIFLSIFFIAAFGLSLFTPFSFRQTIYITFPLAFLAAIGATATARTLENEAREIFSKNKNAPHNNPSQAAITTAARALFFIALSTAMAGAIFEETLKRSPPFNIQELDAFTQLAQATQNQAPTTIIAPFTYNYAIPYYTNHNVVLGAFAEGLPDGQKRAELLWKFFHESTIEEKKIIAKKYGATIICLKTKPQGWPDTQNPSDYTQILGENLATNQYASCHRLKI